MNYRDIVLKLLKKHPSISVIEEVMLADFAQHEDPRAAFMKWCEHSYIEIQRGADGKSITLIKKKK